MNSKIVVAFLVTVCAGSSIAKPTAIFENLQPVRGLTIPRIRSTLPMCQGNDPRAWNRCHSTFKYPNGNIYEGDYVRGRRHGQGTLIINAPGRTSDSYIGSEQRAIYYGTFADDRLNGHGLWVDSNGDQYEGGFKNNIMVSQSVHPQPTAPNPPDANRKNCESFGLQFGTADFAKCMITLEQMSSLKVEKQSAKIADDMRQQQDFSNRVAEIEAQSARVKAEQDAQTAQSVKCAPNWFRIAGAFAQPQLGGFVASVGTASQEMARQREANGCN